MVQKDIDVLTIADFCVDMILSGNDMVPEFGQKEKLIEDYTVEMGGSCTIFASQAAKLGMKTAVAGKLGYDLFADLIIDTLKKANVSCDYVERKADIKTGITTVLSNKEDRAMLTYIGSIDVMCARDVQDEILERTRHFHIGSYFLMKKMQPGYLDLLKRAKTHGVTISLDTNWDPEESWDSGIREILPMVDLFFPNEKEAMAIIGENDFETAISKLNEIIPIIAVKQGDKGATVYNKGGRISSPALPGHMVDAVGAGDSFDAGFVYGFINGLNMRECLLAGNICGSLNTRAAGGTKGQPCIDTFTKILNDIYEEEIICPL